MKAHTEPDSLLIRDIHTLFTADAGKRELRGAFIYAENGEIKFIGQRPPRGLRASRTIDARTCIAVPGLINTHHHLYQTLTRACPAAANACHRPHAGD